MPRDPTFDLQEGFDRIRWGDDEGTVRRHYPAAGSTKVDGGLHPATGKSVKIAPGIVLQDVALPIATDGLMFTARVGFDRQSVTQVWLGLQGQDGRYAKLSPEELGKVVFDKTSALIDKLGVGPVDPHKSRQTWTVGRVKVYLWWDKDGPTIALVPRKLGLTSTRRISRT